ncbi:TetR/AcrR family transcriptional regulator [Cryptosporangium sp. NPDC051539]|uniref:TetR/AcrR family transcriptional regulator n=1 Tax=Cryptosporangium sp. NPDC051539 TaxID=3363962 RepID=UPI0037A46566
MQETYRRSADSAKGRQRRAELLESVTRDLAEHGLVDFSLRRAARAAGTTHKVLLYYFADGDDLLAQALLRLRGQRVGNALQAVAALPSGTLGDRIRAIWPMLEADATGLRVIDQAIGLAMYDPARYAHLAREAAEQYLAPLTGLLPPEWSSARREEVANLLLATFRGFLMDWRTTSDTTRIESALEALARAMDREAADGP